MVGVEMNRKLLVDFMFKTFEIIKVSEECFNNSSNIEEVGSMTGFKIYNKEDLKFKIDELKNKGFKFIIDERRLKE